MVEAILREIEDKNMEDAEKKVEEKLPEEMSEGDVLLLEKLQLKEENLQLKAQMLQQAMQEAQRANAEARALIKAKYKLGDQDQIDSVSRKILRKG